MRVSLGWVPLNSDMTAYRVVSSQGRWFERKNPPRIYTTEKRALGQSPSGKVAEVFMEIDAND